MNDIGRQFEIAVSGEKLLERVISILEQARANVVKAVNSNMVIAYWFIGRDNYEKKYGKSGDATPILTILKINNRLC